MSNYHMAVCYLPCHVFSVFLRLLSFVFGIGLLINDYINLFLLLYPNMSFCYVNIHYTD